jgi:hypothetical protein
MGLGNPGYILLLYSRYFWLSSIVLFLLPSSGFIRRIPLLQAVWKSASN